MWGNPIVTQHISAQPSSRTDSWVRLLRYARLWNLLGFGYWAVEERSTGKLAGDVGFADFHREMSPSIEGIPEAGWVLAPEFSGRGYATEALRAALEWADVSLRTDRTACIIAPENAASIRVAEKVGYVETARTTYRGDPTILLMRKRIMNQEAVT